MKTKLIFHPTQEQIEENLKRVEEGQPLSLSLPRLASEFKDAYAERFGEFRRLDDEERKEHREISKAKTKAKKEGDENDT